MEGPQKLKIELPYDPEILLLCIYTKTTKTLSLKDICIPMCIAALFTIAKMWKQLKCPLMGEWIKKMWWIYLYKYGQRNIIHQKKKRKKFKSYHLEQHG